MANRKITQDEQKERLKIRLEKAQEALLAAEKRLSDLDKDREKVIAKIKEKKIEIEKYQAITRESQYSVLEEMLRLKGISVEDVTKAIANNDTKYLIGLTELKANSEVSDGEPLDTEIEDQPEDSPENKPPETAANAPTEVINFARQNTPDFSASWMNTQKTDIPIEQRQQQRSAYTGSSRANAPVNRASTPITALSTRQPERDKNAAGWQPPQTPAPAYALNNDPKHV